MGYNKVSDWVIQVDPANRVGQEHREVYANAGLALCQAQILEHLLKHFFVLAAAIHRRTSEPPITANDVASAIADLENFEAEISKHTLGRVIHATKSQSLLEHRQELEANLAQSLKDRNALVHRFFWENAVQQQTSLGRRKMVEELKRIEAQFIRTIEDLNMRTRHFGSMWEPPKR